MREAVYLLNNFDKGRLILNEKIAKYPLSLDRGTKRSFYVYMPKEFAMDVSRTDVSECGVNHYFSRRGLPATSENGTITS